MASIHEDTRSERVPIRTLLQSCLNKFRKNVKIVLATTTAAMSGKKDAVPMASVNHAFMGLLRANQEMRHAVQTLREHQKFQEKIVGLEKEVARKDEQILELSKTLRKVQEDMEREIFERAKPLLGKATGTKSLNPIDSKTVLKYARQLSYSTAAPPGWHFTQGLEIPFPYKPAAPQEKDMKQGILFKKKLENVLKAYDAGQEKADDEEEETGAMGEAKDGEGDGQADEDEDDEEDEDAEELDDDALGISSGKKRSLDEEGSDAGQSDQSNKRLKRQKSTASDDVNLFDL